LAPRLIAAGCVKRCGGGSVAEAGWGGGGGGGCINVLTTTSLILRIDHTCRGSLEVALDATSTFMTWGGVGWGAKININVYTDGCQSWKMVARENRKQRLVVKSVVHMRSEWTRKVRVRGRTKVAGPQQIDPCWQHLPVK